MKKILRTKISRRQFAVNTAIGSLGITFIPRHVFGGQGKLSANEKLNVACIGVGGRGAASVNAVHKANNVVALCDVDSRQASKMYKKIPKAKVFNDFRVMMDQMEKEIDAVTVATPDHTHAVAGMAAIKRGKHLYCEKPLAHSIHEIRAMMKAARDYKVITQLGNQGHSFDHIRVFCEWIWDGAIGNVTEVLAGCGAVHCKIPLLPKLKEKHDIPKELDWDYWLGPAQERPYHPMYLPGQWRGWSPFGSGTIGDWICHVVDPVFWALDLGAPSSVQATAENYDPVLHKDTFPAGSKVVFQFPANDKRGPIKLVWHSGETHIPRPPELEQGRKSPVTGAVVIGDKGKIIYGSHGAGGVRIIPEVKMKQYKRPDPTLPRVKGHHNDWLDSIRTGKQAGSNFEYGGPLTELAQLGIIAIKMLGKKLEWDGPNMRFTNNPEANQYINPPYRKGWSL
ncbi:MAG TPA: Gfo/Idh/MocA family oxidoreductase [Verrucomicrobiales bacterium]|nr:Gfo/Idh/MocA family oxidoreductase [Verrucomicrobiales bacterium]HIL69569.1 Gfo/Idh/MocA family oxidoreductase [Verrucomicrobiota bacterium]